MLGSRTQNGHFRTHLVAAGLPDLVGGGPVIGLVELVEQVGVGRQRHRRRVPGLARDFNHSGALGDQEADEAVSQVIRPRVCNLGMLGGLGELALAPIADAVVVPRRAVRGGEDQVEVLTAARARAN